MYLCLFVAVESADITFDTQKFLKNDDKLTWIPYLMALLTFTLSWLINSHVLLSCPFRLNYTLT